MKTFFTAASFFILSIFLFPSTGFALFCTDITSTVSRRDENANVLTLQNFLYDKGYLKAIPNGYFGVGTFSALKAYQKSKGITQTGGAGPATRKAIKGESCGEGAVSVKSPVLFGDSSAKKEETKKPSFTEVKKEEIKTLSNNEKRLRDSETLLRAVYEAFTQSRGVWPVAVNATSTDVPNPAELCVSPRITQMNQATATEVLVLTTPESLCKGYVDVSYLSPSFLSSIPRDPSLATSSVLTGYALLRDEYSVISIIPKTTDSKEIVKARCNFNAGCKTIEKITKEEYKTPRAVLLSVPSFPAGIAPKNGLTISGYYFTATNTLLVQSRITSREYTFGPYQSTDNGRKIILTASSTFFSTCSPSCEASLPVGDYTMQVKNEGGVSETLYFSVRGVTGTALQIIENTVRASSTNVLLGSFSISSPFASKVQGVTLTGKADNPKSLGKIKTLTVVDQSSGKKVSGGPTLSLDNLQLQANESRAYSFLVDVGDVLTNESGFMTYTGYFTITDILTGAEYDVPIKGGVSFTISP